jgi:hypothetical protein
VRCIYVPRQFRIAAPPGFSSTAVGTTYTAWISSTSEYAFYNVSVFARWPEGREIRMDQGELGPKSDRNVQFTDVDPNAPNNPPNWQAEYSDVEGNRWRTDAQGSLDRLF